MEFTKYLFCYFTGNQPEEERVHFAVSDDGYNFTSVNSGKPVIIQKKEKNVVVILLYFVIRRMFFILSQQI